MNDSKLKHGGDIFEASKKYNIPVEKWIDLSTGISPLTYPVPNVPSEQYARLPYEDPEFRKAAIQYYKSDSFLAVAGSQRAIEQLPVFIQKQSNIKQILVPKVGYQEHAFHFQKQQFKLNLYDSFENHKAFDQIQSQLNEQESHLLIIQPNNPTGMSFSIVQIQSLLKQLKPDAFLVMDEAFIDACEQESFIPFLKQHPNLIILRSIGKFFGLAGLRLGFVFAHQSVLNELDSQIGKWQVSSPTQFIANTALRDQTFQKQTKSYIKQLSLSTRNEFKDIEEIAIRVFVSDLFISYLLKSKQAQSVYEKYAKLGILLRLIKVDNQSSLIRVGLGNK